MRFWKENDKQCFEVVVGEPKPLSAFIDVDSNSGKMSVTMGGSSMYYVNINGVNTRVDGDTFETELSTVLVYGNVSFFNLFIHPFLDGTKLFLFQGKVFYLQKIF